MENSKFQIYTGCGKGKTTAAIGLGIRAIGRNKKVYFIQLLKYQESGEEKILKNLKNFTFKKFGFKEFIINNNIKPEHRIQINKAIKYIDYILNKKKFDLLIIDEMNIVLYYNLIKIKKAKEIINKCRQKNIEIIFTGRYAKKNLISFADLVTEMKEKKHYFSDTNARIGIEY